MKTEPINGEAKKIRPLVPPPFAGRHRGLVDPSLEEANARSMITAVEHPIHGLHGIGPEVLNQENVAICGISPMEQSGEIQGKATGKLTSDEITITFDIRM
ncbi:hypothetical protein FIBSPDRAFT_938596 [Athelia psychrophila]|uniref:Uncharacterized protein n=1 Tax=Athelia psychrophila TaxID=1759441 RepID=A0A165Y2W5_9AGAM|nr:hypothetical protein FIBSPDRAFT_938596 [Fibularhizoctonia sp. CBS 109695]